MIIAIGGNGYAKPSPTKFSSVAHLNPSNIKFDFHECNNLY